MAGSETFETILFDIADDGVATITLNRPQVLNAFNDTMSNEFRAVWDRVKADGDIRAVVLRAAGERAFCTGRDVLEIAALEDPEAAKGIDREHPMWRMGPKLNQVWKPVVCAVHGLAGGGAYYWINESDIVVAADDALFFDPHLTYGLSAAPELIGLARRIPMAEASRLLLMGLDERMSAQRAREIGLVSEVVPRVELWPHAHRLAALVAAKPSLPVQTTIRAMWESLEVGRVEALRRHEEWRLGPNVVVDRATLVRPTPRVR